MKFMYSFHSFLILDETGCIFQQCMCRVKFEITKKWSISFFIHFEFLLKGIYYYCNSLFVELVNMNPSGHPMRQVSVIFLSKIFDLKFGSNQKQQQQQQNKLYPSAVQSFHLFMCSKLTIAVIKLFTEWNHWNCHGQEWFERN